ncbi:MAG: universal stress protein [Methanomicrobiales archaeon]|jgi:nucleotide-binding universal stress UspA family protein|nr:universal stress protein [Methanomicrobiales archaeon]
MFAHALVAIDGSAQSDYALSQFLQKIDAKKTKVTVLYVIVPSRYVGIEEVPGYSGTQSFYEFRERLVQQEEEKIRQRVKKISLDESVPVEMVVRIGDPRDEILEVAQEVDASLIVMGSTGKGLGERILLGSVSTYVTIHSRISTMIIR